MSSRQASALASLTANYTDSEDEEHSPVPQPEIEEGEIKSAVSSPIIIVPPDENSNVSSSSSSSSSDNENSPGSGGSGPIVPYQLEKPKKNILGLVPSPKKPTPQNSPLILSKDDKDIEMTEILSSEDESTFLAEKRLKLPPEPEEKCSKALQAKFTKMYEQKLKGFNMNANIQTRKSFRNPSIYEKLILHLNIDEFGTNYPESMFNPHEWSESSFYDELAKVQKTEMDRREKERRERTKIDYVPGTAASISTTKKSTIPSGIVTQQQSDAESKRKTKWDQRGVMPPLLSMTAPPPQPIQIPASIVNSVNNAAGTAASNASSKSKPVTISAFGSLPNKKK